MAPVIAQSHVARLQSHTLVLRKPRRLPAQFPTLPAARRLLGLHLRRYLIAAARPFGGRIGDAARRTAVAQRGATLRLRVILAAPRGAADGLGAPGTLALPVLRAARRNAGRRGRNQGG